MKAYQEEYIANTKEFISLTLRPGPEDRTLEEYTDRLLAARTRRWQLVQRNMELLREELLPALDHLSEADAEERQALQEFSVKLGSSPGQVDVGILCQVQQALASQARQEENQEDLIEHLYWQGMGWFALSNKLVNMEADLVGRYFVYARTYFQEAASYLGDFEQIEDEKTRSYIIRSTANRALGQFRAVGERTRLLQEALEIMENSYYRTLAPQLPWANYVRATHQLMVASISYSKERAMAGKDVAAIMRSVYATERTANPTPRQAFHATAIEFYCGVRSLDHLLTQLERLIDSADSRDFTREGMYANISLPAYYCMYMSQYPERIKNRERFYIAGLYRRVQSYLNVFPPEQENESLFYYLRQLICTFVELEQAIPYRDFLYRLILHFSPELYIHSRAVAEVAKVLCGFLLERDGGCFDGIPFIRDISEPAKKREAVLDYAEGCGLFHDAGQVNCIEIHTRTARWWFPEEDGIARLHTEAGRTLLQGRASTSRFAAAALGHHAWYDGSTVHGYPASYQRSQYPERRMVDVIALADWLVNAVDKYRKKPVSCLPFEEAVGRTAAMGGRQFSPRAAALLEEEPVQAALRQALEDAAQKAYREIYQDSGSRRK